ANVKEDFDVHTKSLQKLFSRFDILQSTVRSNKNDATLCKQLIEQLQDKAAEMKDRSQRNNLQLVGLPESEEGSDPIGFLKSMLPKWISSLADLQIEIERAHTVHCTVLGDADRR
ncbi:UNVERIFIED_CONTAM: hypothetical protein FKN15_061151, partial [Acipenser sinensis]